MTDKWQKLGGRNSDYMRGLWDGLTSVDRVVMPEFYAPILPPRTQITADRRADARVGRYLTRALEGLVQGD